MTDSPITTTSDSAGRRRVPPLWAIASGAAVIVIALAAVLRGGGSSHRAFPETGEVVETFDTDGLHVSSMSDLAVDTDDTMFVPVHDEDHHRSLLKVHAPPRQRRWRLVRTVSSSSPIGAMTA